MPIAAMAQQTTTQAAARSDLAIESDVLHQIAASPELQGEQVIASTRDGAVTLKGSVTSPELKQQAETVASQVSGVTAVNDQLVVAPLVGTRSSENRAPAPDDMQPPEQANNQAQASNQASGDWGPAGPPPDAENGAPPPREAEPQAEAREAEPQQPEVQEQGPDELPAPSVAQSTQPPASADQSGNWGPAGPPPDAVDGRVPPPPANAQADAGVGVGYGPSGPAAGPNANTNPGPVLQSRPPYQGQYPSAQYPSGAYGSGQYSSGQALPPSAPARPATLPPGTLLRVRTVEPLIVSRLQQGDTFDATAAQDVYSGDVLVIPRGAALVGRVLEVKRAGALKGGSELRLQLTNLNLGGATYVLSTDTWSNTGPGKGAYTTGNAAGGAAVGAVIGAIAGGGPGAAIGAAAGTGVGLGASAATPGPNGGIGPEALLTFHLTAPVTVRPVSYQEAQRLAAGSAPARSPYGPPRRPYPYPVRYGYPYPYPPPPYPYPYYRYWR